MRTKLFALFLAVMATNSLWAYDFKYEDLYYNITSNLEPYTVEVTYQDYLSDSNYIALTSVAIPISVIYEGKTYSVTSIGDYAFYSSNLISIAIPNSIISIGEGAFWSSSSLTSVTFQHGIRRIGSFAFSDCSSLSLIDIPNSVTSIGYLAFNRTAIYDNDLYWENDALYINQCLVDAKRNDSDSICDIKPDTRLIADKVFNCFPHIKSVTIPQSVVNIGINPFFGCHYLKSIIVEKDNPIYDSRNLCNAIIETATNTLVTGSSHTQIPEGIKYIGDFAFCGCTYLESIVVPNGVIGIGERSFSDCLYLTSVSLPNSLVNIGARAFDLSPISYVALPSNLATIGERAFEFCPITSIIFPNSLETIGRRAFAHCPLTEITIPNGVKSIGDCAFSDCPISYIKLPQSIIHIGSDAFKGTKFYENTVNWEGDVLYIDNYLIQAQRALSGDYHIKEGTLLVADKAFWQCEFLTYVEIPHSVIHIGEYAFCLCSALDSICMSKNTTTLGACAFSGCSSLPCIILPNNLDYIGKSVFNSCTSLMTIMCEMTDLPILGKTVFRNMLLQEATLYVPTESLEDYKSAEQWKDFGTILPIKGTALENSENANSSSIKKMLHNGHVVILHNDKSYSIMGQETE